MNAIRLKTNPEIILLQFGFICTGYLDCDSKD